MILIDNYDSFTYNIVEYFKLLGKTPAVYKNDEITINELKKKNFSFLVLSPGPDSPNDAGITLDVIDYFKDKKKILGVCLGFQAIAQYFGYKIIKAKEPVHGEVSKIYFKEDEKLFKGFKQGFLMTRYHSLIVDEGDINLNKNSKKDKKEDKKVNKEVNKNYAISKECNGSVNADKIIKTAWLEDERKTMMALRVNENIYGVQFHPEAILSKGGIGIFKNFLKL